MGKVRKTKNIVANLPIIVVIHELYKVLVPNRSINDVPYLDTGINI